MTNIEALKELYVKMGGSLTDTYEGIADGVAVGEMSLLADLIAAVSKLAADVAAPYTAGSFISIADKEIATTLHAGSGVTIDNDGAIKADSQLPAVTNTDDGMVLKVAEGVWTKGEAGGGTAMMEVKISGSLPSQGSQSSFTMDKTAGEIREAIQNGSYVYISFTNIINGSLQGVAFSGPLIITGTNKISGTMIATMETGNGYAGIYGLDIYTGQPTQTSVSVACMARIATA